MGIIARTVETSTFALDIRSLMDNLPAPLILGPADQPHVAPPYRSLLERTSEVLENLAASGDARYSDAAFAARHQAAAPAARRSPESTEGNLLQASA
ncbi:hypothetical protein [Megalodesulfovibrio gigas]|uniref:Uncharacterized protein n=1 Tax=Megalodesulfovibrio gigas (strain ATCC 19364 / DSM 1382 / NCIMB 9332 / VKM B-1759) TaxID=1121448 RepID=T2GD06_MEGG1|nr:hypothetical protein [Megalodesulfovibrio gigas]AGW14465.1 hypothetical protein DGI_2734 [Megalodesulfovibrio gigas DSM 1382 = ATCC 19364]